MKQLMALLVLLSAQNTFALYGQKIEEAKDPFMASLHLRDTENPTTDFFCNGVLIAPTKILTAGHCIDSLGVNIYDMSTALVESPDLMAIKVGKNFYKAKKVKFAESYFESSDFSSEDLALIDLETPVKGATPIKLALASDLVLNEKLTLIARNKKVETSLSSKKSYGAAGVLFLDKKAGACLGDSGGAIVVKKNGQQVLAGILMYSGERMCESKTGYGYLPKAQL